MNKLTIASALAMAAFAPAMGSAQVVSDVNDLIAETTSDLDATFNSIAVNDSAIDGSIDISHEGQGGGSVSSSYSDVTEIGVDGALSADVEGSLAGLEGTLPQEIIDGVALNGELAVEVDADFSDTDSFAFEEVTQQTQFDIGELEATALGATNTGTLSFAGGGEVVESASEAATDATMASASFSSSEGSNIDVREIASNTADITGNATISTSGSGSLDGITTTAAGAINTSDIMAGIVGGEPDSMVDTGSDDDS